MDMATTSEPESLGNHANTESLKKPKSLLLADSAITKSTTSRLPGVTATDIRRAEAAYLLSSSLPMARKFLSG